MMRAVGLIIAVLGGATPALAFEGVLHQTTTIAQLPPMTSEVSVRQNGDTRTDSIVPGTGESVSVIQRTSGTAVITVTLMHAKKMYTEMTAKTDAPPPAGAAEMLKNLEVKIVGDETIAEHACKHVQLIQSSDTTIDVWMAADISIAGETARNPQGIAAGMLKMFEEKGVKGFPLQMKATHAGQSLTLTTTRVDMKKLDPAMFEVPKGYTKM